MKILHYMSAIRREDGGVVKAVLDLVEMSRTTDELSVASFDLTDVPGHWESSENPVSVHQLNGSAGNLSSDVKDQLRALIKAHDVVHLHAMWNPANPKIAALCKELGVPYVLSIHGMLDDWCMAQRKIKKLVYLKTLGRNLLRDASFVHCTAQAELDQASAWFDRDKGVVLPLPFDLSEFEHPGGFERAQHAFPELDAQRPRVLFLSRIHYKKGVDRLLRAGAILNERGVNHQLVIAGTGDEPYVKEMHKLASDLSLGESVYFSGFASGEEKVALYGACDVFALPTSQENFGFVFFEALAAGTLVLTTKGTDTWPEIEASGGGVITDNTPEAFADAIESLLSDPDRCASMGAAGRDWAMREMDMDRVRGRYHEMYASISAPSVV